MTVFRENLLLQKLKRSSILGPNKSIIMQLRVVSYPYQYNVGIPTPPYNVLVILASNCNWGCFDFESSFVCYK